MTPSNFNIDTLMLALHKKIEEYADFTSSKINDGDPIEHVNYPPNNGFSDLEEKALVSLKDNPQMQSALRKLFADNIAGVLFDLFNLLDGTSDPNPELGQWSELYLVDKSDNVQPNPEMLHDKFFESYWDWRKMRNNPAWKLDISED